jgi:hypothetical protein
MTTPRPETDERLALELHHIFAETDLPDGPLLCDALAKARELLTPAIGAEARRAAYDEVLGGLPLLALTDWLQRQRDAIPAPPATVGTPARRKRLVVKDDPEGGLFSWKLTQEARFERADECARNGELTLRLGAALNILGHIRNLVEELNDEDKKAREHNEMAAHERAEEKRKALDLEDCDE